MAAPLTGRLRPRITATPVEPTTKCVAKSKTSAERFRDFYRNLKNDEEKYASYLHAKKKASKEAYEKAKLNDDEEEKKRKNELNRLRVEKCRKKKKEAGIVAPKPSNAKPLTRLEKEKKEETLRKDAQRKREERAKWSRQKKKAEADKAKENRRKKKEIENERKNGKVVEKENEIVDDERRTPGARKKALSRAMAAVPKNKKAAANTVMDMFEKYHGKKRLLNEAVHRIMKDRAIVRRVAERLNGIDKKSQRQALKQLQLSHRRLDKIKKSKSFATTKLRKSDNEKATIVQRFLTEHGRYMPDKKSVGRCGPKLILDETMETLFLKFQNDYPSTSISRSFFYNNRPRNVRTARSTGYNQCLCECCENLDLKLEVLNKVEKRISRSKTALLDLISCKKEGDYHKLECIKQTCKMCGAKKIKELVGENADVMGTAIKVKEWKSKKVTIGEVQCTKKVLEEEVMEVKELVERLVRDLTTYPMHHFNAKWQGEQFRRMKKQVSNGEVVMVLDFAENYRCEMQDEVQSAHWSYSQCTVHPTVCYYNCNKCKEGHTVTHSVIAISDDTKHDYFAVEAFLDKTFKLLRENGINLRRCIQWTDGCGAQYKSKNPFYLMQESRNRYDFMIERNFFGSRHGKGPSDGESAVLKSAATRSVKMRKVVIQNAEDMFRYAERYLSRGNELEDGSCCLFRRSFVFVKSTDIKRRTLPVKSAIKGTCG